MRQKKDLVYLSIAGFNICLNFQPAPWKNLKIKLKQEILNFLQGFRLRTKSSKIDYQIDIVWDRYTDIKFYFNRKNFNSEYYFINYCETEYKNKSICYYRISLFEFSIMLRQIITYLLRNSEALSLHASAVGHGEKANIFLGKSGAGKSTIRHLLKKKYISLADDYILIRKESSSYYVYQLPFFEGKIRIRKTSKKYLLNGTFFLEKAKDLNLTPVTDKELLIRLIAKQLLLENKKRPVKQQMQTVLKFVSEFHRFYKLKFTKNESKLLLMLNNNNL